MLREFQKERAALVARAQHMVAAADAENRDLTDVERAEFVDLLGEGESTGEIGKLDERIARIQDERERLRAAAEKKFSALNVEKPDSGSAGKMKMTEFRKLSPLEQMSFIKSGGKLED